MGDRAKRAFRPGVERVEGRALTTGGAAAAAEILGGGAGLFQAAHGLHAQAAGGAVKALGGGHKHPVHGLGFPAGPLPIGNGLGQGLVRLTLPLHFLDYGVITLWNNTPSVVRFQVSASTFAGGQFFQFAIPSGGFRSFYAPVIDGQTPLFQVALNPNFRPIVIPQVNIVFESPAYFPAGTAGRPYAINFGVNGLYLSYI
jgi:hypothetical protein